VEGHEIVVLDSTAWQVTAKVARSLTGRLSRVKGSPCALTLTFTAWQSLAIDAIIIEDLHITHRDHGAALARAMAAGGFSRYNQLLLDSVWISHRLNGTADAPLRPIVQGHGAHTWIAARTPDS